MTMTIGKEGFEQLLSAINLCVLVEYSNDKYIISVARGCILEDHLWQKQLNQVTKIPLVRS